MNISWKILFWSRKKLTQAVLVDREVDKKVACEKWEENANVLLRWS